jgi:hypothetical protein
MQSEGRRLFRWVNPFEGERERERVGALDGCAGKFPSSFGVIFPQASPSGALIFILESNFEGPQSAFYTCQPYNSIVGLVRLGWDAIAREGRDVAYAEPRPNGEKELTLPLSKRRLRECARP